MIVRHSPSHGTTTRTRTPCEIANSAPKAASEKPTAAGPQPIAVAGVEHPDALQHPLGEIGEDEADDERGDRRILRDHEERADRVGLAEAEPARGSSRSSNSGSRK